MKFQRLFLLVLLVPTVSSLIISSVYAGKKKFKTFSFDTPLLPAIVKVQPNKFHLTFRNYKYMRTPQFKIEGTLPLKAPTIIKEVFKPDPNPEITEFNIGDMAAIPEADQHIAYDNTHSYPIFAHKPSHGLQVPQPSHVWTPINTARPVEQGIHRINGFESHHRVRRFANEYNNQFNANQRNPYFSSNFGHNFDPQNQPNPNPNNFVMAHNSQPYQSYNAPNHHNYYPNTAPFAFGNQYQNSHSPQNSFNENSQIYSGYETNPDMSASPSSFSPPKYEKVFAPSNHQNNKWIPIDSPSPPSHPPVPHNPSSGHSVTNYENYDNTPEASHQQKKINIGEQYNPSASYLDETVVSKPTYDPDSDPDEGSVSFSISGPHGGEEVPLGYEKKIKEMHEELKNHPEHLPPGMDMSQIMKYYTQHTFTDPLKSSYGYKPSFGPLGFLKSKLKSLTKFI